MWAVSNARIPACNANSLCLYARSGTIPVNFSGNSGFTPGIVISCAAPRIMAGISTPLCNLTVGTSRAAAEEVVVGAAVQDSSPRVPAVAAAANKAAFDVAIVRSIKALMVSVMAVRDSVLWSAFPSGDLHCSKKM